MRIGIDVDGVLIDNTSPTLELLFKRTGIRLTLADLTEWNAWEKFGLNTGMMLKIIDDCYNQGLVGPMEKNLGASLSRLRNKKHQVVIITKRTPPSHESMLQYIRARRLPYDSFVLCFHGDNKLSYPIDVLIDDHPKSHENIAAYPQKKIFLRDQPWNRDPTLDLTPGIQRVQTVKEAVDLILGMGNVQSC